VLSLVSLRLAARPFVTALAVAAGGGLWARVCAGAEAVRALMRAGVSGTFWPLDRLAPPHPALADRLHRALTK
jgi:hypothetical protein